MPDNELENKSPDIVGEACAWIAQLETGNMSQEDMRAFKEWIERSPAHFVEIRKLAALSSETNILSDMSHSISKASRERRLSVRKERFGGRYLRPVLASCAALVVMFVAGMAIYNQSAITEPYMIATPIGGFEQQALADGTVVKLNTNSRLEVDYDRELRRVRLLKGEASFDVAHNPKRPFQVYIDDKIVKAVGTAFTVRWTDGDLSVTVSEGRVAFAPSDQVSEPLTVVKNSSEQPAQTVEVKSLEAPLFLDAGQKLSLPHEEEPTLLASLPDRDLRSERAWESGLLDFTDKPLAEIINEMSRYTDLEIEFAEADLEEIRFNGIFRTDEIERLLEAIETDEDIEVEQLNPKRVRIKRAQN